MISITLWDCAIDGYSFPEVFLALVRPKPVTSKSLFDWKRILGLRVPKTHFFLTWKHLQLHQQEYNYGLTPRVHWNCQAFLTPFELPAIYGLFHGQRHHLIISYYLLPPDGQYYNVTKVGLDPKSSASARQRSPIPTPAAVQVCFLFADDIWEGCAICDVGYACHDAPKHKHPPDARTNSTLQL